MRHKILTFAQNEPESDAEFLRRVEVAMDTYVNQVNTTIVGFSLTREVHRVYHKLMFATVVVYG